MKTKISLIISLLFLSIHTLTAQSEQDMETLSIFSEYVKSKNYNAAYAPWMELRARNPKFNKAIYVYGERILNHKISNSEGEEKTAFILDLLKLWEERSIVFPNVTPKGAYLAKASQLKYNNKELIVVSNEDLYNEFDNAYVIDSKTFTNPKSLYTYFSLMVDLYDSSLKSAQELFSKYDDISEKIDFEVKNYTNKRNAFLGEDGEVKELSRKDTSRLKSYNSYLRAYDQIAGSIDTKLGSRANCENLIPLYQRDFEAFKNDGIWLQRAMNRMYAKGCNDDPLFVQIVEQKNALEPNADTAFYLGVLKEKVGKSTEALSFYNQAVELETSSFEKSKILYKIATNFKKKSRYGQARTYYMKVLKANPSMGRAHLAIAAMYAKSANNCGTDNFSKRAVYWLASKEAAKAGRIDPTMKKNAKKSIANYEAKAPQKSEIFSSGRTGQVIAIGCWIQRSVTVPSL
jgi:tetratricopeptide (TPR) repeat protein